MSVRRALPVSGQGAKTLRVEDVPMFANEAEMVDSLIDVAHAYGWRVQRQRAAMTRDGQWRTAIQGDAGVPDLLMLHPSIPTILAWEAKMPGNKPTVDQECWLALWQLRGADARVIYPVDYNGAVKILAGGKP